MEHRPLHASPSLPDILSRSPPLAHQTSPSRRTLPLLMTPGGLSSVDLQQHIYNSLLESRTADIALHVSGSHWEAVYKLHRVVLIQSGFFSSLFTAGFCESSPKLGTQLRGPEQVNIVFDDRNITRAAFEVCISRLYGGGPPLHVSPSLIPTTLHPLTPSFPGPTPSSDVPQAHHPASPSFLLSLLATSVYLSIPSVASQALSCILNTVGPYTAVLYLSFATGTAIHTPGENEPEAAVGLEKIADLVTSHSTDNSTSTSMHSKRRESRDVLADKLHDLDVQKEDPSESDSESDVGDRPSYTPCFNYGAVSDKIGEAAVCWLARWGPDMLAHEEKASRAQQSPASPLPVVASPSASRQRADTFPSRTIPEELPIITPHRVPVIWARSGLTSRWVRELISSDALFVKGERERYDLARTVVELRRLQGIDGEEEKEWEVMFREGIYYANMLVEDIIAISHDISSTTGQPFVSLSVLQAAHWNQSLLRCHITKSNGSTSSPPSSPPLRDKELGVCSTTAEIFSRRSEASTFPEKDRIYYPVAHDSSLRIGDSTGVEGASMDQLFEPSARSLDKDNKAPVRAVTSEANFFGLKAEWKTASECVAGDATGTARWSPYPPCRFAVEFWDIDSLKEKARLHSHTIWYAGSLFNVYVQVVRKKGIQLGVYLHRQSSVDPIPSPSAPVHAVIRIDRSHNRAPSAPQPIPASLSSPSVHHSPSIHPPTRSTTPNSTSNSSALVTTYQSSGNSIPATAPAVAPVQPYRDPRRSVSAYFHISCASSTGSSLTRFTSVPDVFSVSQSWGWKSSSLRTEDFGEFGADGQLAKPVPAPRELSLRATIVLGIV